MEPVNRTGPRRDHTGGRTAPDAIGGWLLVLSRLLLVWHPVLVGLNISSALGSVPFRGPSLMVVLIVRLLVAALGVSAGLALIRLRPAAVSITRLALLAAAATDLFVYTTSYVPHNRAPGETPFWIAGSLIYYGAWLLYLFKSKRVRATFAPSADANDGS